MKLWPVEHFWLTSYKIHTLVMSKQSGRFFFSICVAFSEYLYFISSCSLYQGCPGVRVTGVYIGPSLDKKAANVHMTYKDKKN